MKTSILKLTTALAIAGEVMPAGSLVEVSRSEASDLLHRGRAVVHQPAAGDGEVFHAGGDATPAAERDHDAVADAASVGDHSADQPAAGDGEVPGDKPARHRRKK